MENTKIPLNRTFSKDIYFEPHDLIDGKLLTEDDYAFSIHKIQLSKFSKYFYRLFCGIGKNEKEYFIPGIEGKVLDNILLYMYTGKVIVNERNLCDIIIAVDYLMIDELLRYIEEVCMKDSLSFKNCLSVLSVAFQINQKRILQESYRFVQTHFEYIVEAVNSEFGKLPLDILKQLLLDRSLYASSENSVWLMIMRWVQYKETHRMSQVPDLLMYLAYSDVTEELASKILENKIVAQNPCCEKINELKTSSPCNSNLNIFLNYIKSRNELSMFSENRRMPENLNFVARYCVRNETEGVNIYVTYDENMDLWRKILETDFSPEIFIAIDHIIYMFQRSENINYRFNVVLKELNTMAKFRSSRNYYDVVQLGRLIYVLGGTSVHTGHEMNEVEMYDPAFELWLHAAPMIPVTSFSTVCLGSNIYVVGIQPNFSNPEMIAQIYDPNSDSWSILPPPSILCCNFALVVYREKLYVIGGRNEKEYIPNVQIFDPAKEEWITSKSLPHVYYFPKAIILNDQLIVYDNHLEDRNYMRTNPAVIWNEVTEDWNLFKESSSMNTIHNYCFFNTDNKDCIRIISRENKASRKQFFKSPFRRTIDQ